MSTRTMLGLVVVFVGLTFLADNFGFVHARQLFDYWPLLLLGFGVVKLTEPRGCRGGRTVGIAMSIAGVALSAMLFLHGPVPFDALWSLLFIFFGVTLITRKWDARPGRSGGAGGDAVTVPGGIDESISGLAFWSGFKRRSTSPAFKRADLTAFMGGVDLDLRQATATPNGAVVDVLAIWGGIVIRVPPDWAVSNEVVAIMGGVDDRSSGGQDARNRLIIRGMVLMGGVEIKT